MALNLADRIAVMETLRPRVIAVCVNYALYLLGTQAPTAAQLSWARNAMRSPDGTGEQLKPYILNDPNFIADGSGMTDAQLTGVVEAAINTHFIIEP